MKELSPDLRPDQGEALAEKVYSLIPEGKIRAIPMSFLASLLNTNERETRRAVLMARMHGKIICGTSEGYFKPESDEELLDYYHKARKRCITGLASLREARKLLIERGALGGTEHAPE